MEFYSPQQISGIFDFLPWVRARCPGCREELVVQVVLLREMRWECSCSLLSDRITHLLHVSLVFMQHVNYWCDPYKLLPEQPINCWRGWLKKVLSNLANIGLTHHSAAWILCLAKPIKPYFFYWKDIDIISKMKYHLKDKMRYVGNI